MASYWIWWLLAAGLVVAELVTGTFYLLAVAVAFALGGFAALFGVPFEVQLVAAAAIALVGIFVAYRWRPGRPSGTREPSFDVGQSVRVQAWNPDGSARVAYRGTLWQAQPASPDVPRVDTMYIVDVRGSTLIVSDRKP